MMQRAWNHHWVGLALIVATALPLVGCVQRTITITSQPPGALAFLNDTEVGRTPTRVPFTFYGTYDVRLVKEGYQTLHTPAEAKAPWWDTIGVDLFAEAAPGTQHVDLKWDFELIPAVPAEQIDPEGIIDRGQQLRALLRRGE